ncbi:hypothetical protein NE619_09065 [Anaerovorax odorimutans]|uniref:Uncharacterized protein n=1 Tax=Anaerovorax odorimutans TaxID=109327 RepID=A0ABT1RNW3_9FIRM|nr:hypothetical protein [Anaerovorax odorimutans]MCQ4636880.1 hypothetical protein [Anaerovorax odorimutans]
MSGTGHKIKHYDLAGLKLIFYSQIASMILAIIGACTQEHLMISIIISVLALAAAAVSVVGVFKLGRYGTHFKKCRRIVVAMFIMIFAMVVLFLILINHRQPDLLTAAALFLPAVVGFIAWILGLLFIYHLFYGCGEIGEREEDEKFSSRCRRGWKIYIVCYILFVLSLVAAGIYIFMDNQFSTVSMVLVAVAVVCGIVMLVKILQVAYITYKKYDGAEIGAAGKKKNGQILSELSDTMEVPVPPEDH